MANKTVQWILWAIAMVVFLALTLSGHTALLGLAITAVACNLVHGCAASPSGTTIGTDANKDHGSHEHP